MNDTLTARTLAAASALLDAAARDDRFAMRRLLRAVREPGTDDQVGEIVRHAATTYGVDVGLILAGSKLDGPTRARQVVCYAASLLGHSYSHVGRQLDRDHTTVMYACRRVSATPHMRTVAEQIAAKFGWDREAAS